jgi:hypothetical protein
MKTRYALGGVALAVALGALSACTYETGGRQPTAGGRAPTGVSTTGAQGRAAPGAEQGKHHPDAAPALLGAAERLPLSRTESATVRMLRQQLHESWQSVDAAFRVVRDHLATQVRLGVLNPAQLQADEDVAARALAAHQSQSIFALNSLHALLSPEQRVWVAAAVRTEQPGLAEAQARPGGEEGMTEKLNRLTRDLALDPAQQQQVAALVAAQPAAGPEHLGARQRFDAMLSSFPTVTFDARATAPKTELLAAMVHEHLQHRLEFFKDLLPILRPDQRARLAATIASGDWGHGRSGNE